jgi:hypothetical protein
MKRRNLYFAVFLIAVQVVFALWQSIPYATVTESKGSKRVILDIDAYTDERNTELFLVPGAKSQLYFYLRDNGTTLNLTRFMGGTVYTSGFQAIFKYGNGYTQTSKTLTAATPNVDGAVYCTLAATDVTSLTRYCAIFMTSGTMRVLTEYIKITPDGVSRP